MAIAKGRTNCKAERDIVKQGFEEQLKILVAYNKQQEASLKSELYDILTDFSKSTEEKRSESVPLYNQLQELEDQNIRIRRAIFIGMYSFWEVSIKEILNTYSPFCVKSEKKTSKKNKKNILTHYLSEIYPECAPPLVDIINHNIREFRNYSVHGTLSNSREKAINELIQSHPEFCIKSVDRSYYIDNFKGLNAILKLFQNELDNAEDTIKNKTIYSLNNLNNK